MFQSKSLHRYGDVLQQSHDQEHLAKFEDLLEAAIDLDKIPDEYLICASYDPGLEVFHNFFFSLAPVCIHNSLKLSKLSKRCGA